MGKAGYHANIGVCDSDEEKQAGWVKSENTRCFCVLILASNGLMFNVVPATHKPLRLDVDGEKCVC